MSNLVSSLQLMDIFVLIWLGISLSGLCLVDGSFKSSINHEYMTKDSCKYYRGIFAFAVLLHHISQKTDVGIIYKWMFYDIGIYCVAIFFFISGYGLMKSYIKSSNYSKWFIAKRVPKVLIPYILITICRWIECIFMGMKHSLKDVFDVTQEGKPFVPFSWFIITILIFYIVYWALMKICKENYISMVFGAVVGYICYTLVCIKIGLDGWWYETAPVIIFGMLWGMYEKKIIDILNRKKSLFWGLYFLSILCVLLMTIYDIYLHKILNFKGCGIIIWMIKSLLFVFNFMLFTMKIKIGNKLLLFLGEISLEIYLIQGLVIEGPRFGTDNEFLWSIYVIITTVILSYLFHLLNKKMISGYMRMTKLD